MGIQVAPINQDPTNSIDGGFVVKNFVLETESGLALKIRADLIEEYAVKTMAEKMIVDLAVTAYIRYLECSRLYNSLIQPEAKHSYNEDTEEEEENGWTYNHNPLKINAIREFGKQMSMANQQYITALIFLKEFKRPPINVKIHTKQAFVAENQQFNKNA